eukprot:274205-Chlamydomonas_euryale.AAC.2
MLQHGTWAARRANAGRPRTGAQAAAPHAAASHAAAASAAAAALAQAILGGGVPGAPPAAAVATGVGGFQARGSGQRCRAHVRSIVTAVVGAVGVPFTARAALTLAGALVLAAVLTRARAVHASAPVTAATAASAAVAAVAARTRAPHGAAIAYVLRQVRERGVPAACPALAPRGRTPCPRCGRGRACSSGGVAPRPRRGREHATATAQLFGGGSTATSTFPQPLRNLFSFLARHIQRPAKRTKNRRPAGSTVAGPSALRRVGCGRQLSKLATLCDCPPQLMHVPNDVLPRPRHHHATELWEACIARTAPRVQEAAEHVPRLVPHDVAAAVRRVGHRRRVHRLGHRACARCRA